MKCHELPVTLAMSTPPVRMVVVEVYANRDGAGGWESNDYQIHPVLALLACHEIGYRKPAPPDGKPPAVAPTHEGMVALGWKHDHISPFLKLDVVILDNDLGLCPAGEACRAVNTAFEVVACDWPPMEDVGRLAPVIEKVRAEARAKVEALDRAKARDRAEASE